MDLSVLICGPSWSPGEGVGILGGPDWAVVTVGIIATSAAAKVSVLII